MASPKLKPKNRIEVKVSGPDGKPLTVLVGREGISDVARKKAMKIVEQVKKDGLTQASSP